MLALAGLPIGWGASAYVRNSKAAGPGTEDGEWQYVADIGWEGQSAADGNGTANVFQDLGPGQDNPKIGTLSGGWKSSNDGYDLGSLPNGSAIRAVFTWAGTNDRVIVEIELPPCP